MIPILSTINQIIIIIIIIKLVARQLWDAGDRSNWNYTVQASDWTRAATTSGPQESPAVTPTTSVELSSPQGCSWTRTAQASGATYASTSSRPAMAQWSASRTTGNKQFACFQSHKVCKLSNETWFFIYQSFYLFFFQTSMLSLSK